MVVTGCGGASGADRLAVALSGEISVLVGHSGVGKSTLINALSPDADRAVGRVNGVTGRGRHTSTSSEAFELPGGGWIVDTPGVRSFGLGHVGADDVLAVFPDVRDAASWCLPLCTHAQSEPSCALDAFARGEAPFGAGSGGGTGPGSGVLARRASRVASARRLLDAVATAEAASRAARG